MRHESTVRSRVPHQLLLVAVAVLALPAAAAAGPDIAVRPAHELPVELIRPMPGEVLVGGREATVEWRPLRELETLGIDEWEAFLSFDGGRHWPVRVTPHLDIELSSFRFVVPDIPSDEVRLMLRFGDERRETGYILPMTLRSVVYLGCWTPPRRRPAHRARRRGRGSPACCSGWREIAAEESSAFVPPAGRRAA
jgi:hypothetical protein